MFYNALTCIHKFPGFPPVPSQNVETPPEMSTHNVENLRRPSASRYFFSVLRIQILCYRRGCKSNMTHQIQLRKFDMSSIASDKVVVMIGKRETGKSVLVRDLLYQHRDLPIGCVISPTEAANKFFGNMVPSLFIHDEFTPELVGNVVKRQKAMQAAADKHKALHHGGSGGGKASSAIDQRAFLVLDDCMYDETWTRDRNIRLLFMNGRHYKIMFVITMQFPLGIPPTLRTQIDYVFILRENVIGNRKRIFENYAGMFPSFDVFCQVMNQCTENFECLVINNNAKSNRFEDQVFWYKADIRPPFQIGASEFWALSQQNEAMAAAGDGEEEMVEAAAAMRKKAGPRITVKKTSW